jgi:hypothetical protein
MDVGGYHCIMVQRSHRAAEDVRLIETASKGSYHAHKGEVGGSATR